MFEPNSVEDALYSDNSVIVVSVMGDIVSFSCVFTGTLGEKVLLCSDEFILSESALDANGVPFDETWD